MKKTLTQNITRYDNKMTLRINVKTVKAIIISLIAAAIVFALFIKLFGMVITLILSVTVFLLVFIYKIGMVGGVPLSDYVRKIFRMLIKPGEQNLEYSHEKSEYRIVIEGEENEKNK